MPSTRLGQCLLSTYVCAFPFLHGLKDVIDTTSRLQCLEAVDSLSGGLSPFLAMIVYSSTFDLGLAINILPQSS